MELIVDGQGIGVYKIPRGSTLFRGDSDKYLYQQQVMRLQERPTFFGLDQENVEENYTNELGLELCQNYDLSDVDEARKQAEEYKG